MLKIKDSVDLKELKKFGFIKYQSLDTGEWYYCICDLFIGKNKKILQDDGCNECRAVDYQLNEQEIDVLYDLIKADMVEKVEG